MAKATFGAGCFWHPQHVLDRINGINETWVGYMGGHTAKPNYEEVCYSKTGHVEVVHVDYDPDKISYDELLEAFWEMHDPTHYMRQGADVGEQYRSVVFTHDAAQVEAATASKARLEASGKHANPVLTAVEPAQTFWEGEDYHQKYFDRRNHPNIL